MRKAKVNDYVKLHKPFIYLRGKMIDIGKIKKILENRIDEYNGRYLIKCSNIKTYRDREEFIVLTEDEYLVSLI